MQQGLYTSSHHRSVHIKSSIFRFSRKSHAPCCADAGACASGSSVDIPATCLHAVARRHHTGTQSLTALLKLVTTPTLGKKQRQAISLSVPKSIVISIRYRSSLQHVA